MRSSKADMLAELRRLLHDIFVARAERAHYNRLARAHGYVDGFMRALLESGQCTKGGRKREGRRPCQPSPRGHRAGAWQLS
jgi:hypothetical protein